MQGGIRVDADTGHGDDRCRLQLVHQGKAFQNCLAGLPGAAEELFGDGAPVAQVGLGGRRAVRVAQHRAIAQLRALAEQEVRP